MEMNEEDRKKRIAQLNQSYQLVRTEIKTRIDQRNSFSVQFIAATGAIMALGLKEDFKYSAFLFLLLPLLSAYYCMQILYTYDLHDRCHKFLVEEIEPELSKLLGFNEEERNRFFWESYCDMGKGSYNKGGTRKLLFQIVAMVMPLIACLLFFFIGYEKKLFETYVLIIIASCAFVIFLLISIRAVFFYGNHKKISVDWKNK